MSVLAASLRREWGRLRASPWDWAMVSWVPMLVLALMCWIFSAGQPYRLPIAVWSEDSSALSRQLVRMLQATPGLEVRQTVLNRGEAADALLRREVYGVVHIPPDLETHVKQGRGGAVTLLHNAQLATASSLLQLLLQLQAPLAQALAQVGVLCVGGAVVGVALPRGLGQRQLGLRCVGHAAGQHGGGDDRKAGGHESDGLGSRHAGHNASPPRRQP